MPVGAPRRSLVRHKEFRLNSGKLIGQGGELQIPRNHTMLNAEDRLHRPKRSGGIAKTAPHVQEKNHPRAPPSMPWIGFPKAVVIRSAHAITPLTDASRSN